MLHAVRSPAVCLAFLVLSACVSDEPATVGIEGESHVEVHDLPGWGPPQIDLLFVVDDTTAMAPYRERVAELPSIIADAYPNLGSGLVDLHIAVTSNDGMLRRAHPNGQPFVAIRTEFDLQHATNFQGTLREALGRLTATDATSTGPSTPLAAVQRVLESDDGGFRREDASLGIVVMTASDDASPEPVGDYARRFKASKLDPAMIVVSGIVAQPSPRLEELLAEFPNRHTVVSIDAPDYGPTFTLIGQLIRTILPGMCWNASDVDPVTPGIQYECTFTVEIRGAQRVLPECKLDGEQFCWKLIPDRQCAGGNPHGVVMPPYHFYWFVPALHVECVVL